MLIGDLQAQLETKGTKAGTVSQDNVLSALEPPKGTTTTNVVIIPQQEFNTTTGNSTTGNSTTLPNNNVLSMAGSATATATPKKTDVTTIAVLAGIVVGAIVAMWAITKYVK